MIILSVHVDLFFLFIYNVQLYFHDNNMGSIACQQRTLLDRFLQLLVKVNGQTIIRVVRHWERNLQRVCTSVISSSREIKIIMKIKLRMSETITFLYLPIVLLLFIETNNSSLTPQRTRIVGTGLANPGTRALVG